MQLAPIFYAAITAAVTLASFNIDLPALKKKENKKSEEPKKNKPFPEDFLTVYRLLINCDNYYQLLTGVRGAVERYKDRARGSEPELIQKLESAYSLKRKFFEQRASF